MGHRQGPGHGLCRVRPRVRKPHVNGQNFPGIPLIATGIGKHQTVQGEEGILEHLEGGQHIQAAPASLIVGIGGAIAAVHRLGGAPGEDCVELIAGQVGVGLKNQGHGAGHVGRGHGRPVQASIGSSRKGGVHGSPRCRNVRFQEVPAWLIPVLRVVDRTRVGCRTPLAEGCQSVIAVCGSHTDDGGIRRGSGHASIGGTGAGGVRVSVGENRQDVQVPPQEDVIPVGQRESIVMADAPGVVHRPDVNPRVRLQRGNPLESGLKISRASGLVKHLGAHHPGIRGHTDVRAEGTGSIAAHHGPAHVGSVSDPVQRGVPIRGKVAEPDELSGKGRMGGVKPRIQHTQDHALSGVPLGPGLIRPDFCDPPRNHLLVPLRRVFRRHTPEQDIARHRLHPEHVAPGQHLFQFRLREFHPEAVEGPVGRHFLNLDFALRERPPETFLGNPRKVPKIVHPLLIGWQSLYISPVRLGIHEDEDLKHLIGGGLRQTGRKGRAHAHCGHQHPQTHSHRTPPVPRDLRPR